MPPIPWQAWVYTMMPQAFPGTLGVGVVGRGLQRALWALCVRDLQRFCHNKERIDGRPAGGGPGMVMRADILHRALSEKRPSHLIIPTPRGFPLRRKHVEKWANLDGVSFLCGRYDGIDERLLEIHASERISLGESIYSGGEVVTMACLEATIRLLPGILGNTSSVEGDAFHEKGLDHPQYTLPRTFAHKDIPQVLLEGNHKRIALWRKEQARRETQKYRPDLLAKITPRNPQKS